MPWMTRSIAAIAAGADCSASAARCTATSEIAADWTITGARGVRNHVGGEAVARFERSPRASRRPRRSRSSARRSR